MIQHRTGPAFAAAALLLSACGGGAIDPAPQDASTRVEVLATSSRGIGNVVYKDGAAWAPS
jgi:hypothetical protein